MRDINRIDLFLEKVDFRILLRDIWKIPDMEDIEILEHYVSVIVSNIDDITEYWKDCPDLRFSQVLIATGVLPNISGMWYYMEEDEILELQKQE